MERSTEEHCQWKRDHRGLSLPCFRCLLIVMLMDMVSNLNIYVLSSWGAVDLTVVKAKWQHEAGSTRVCHCLNKFSRLSHDISVTKRALMHGFFDMYVQCVPPIHAAWWLKEQVHKSVWWELAESKLTFIISEDALMLYPPERPLASVNYPHSVPPAACSSGQCSHTVQQEAAGSQAGRRRAGKVLDTCGTPIT